MNFFFLRRQEKIYENKIYVLKDGKIWERKTQETLFITNCLCLGCHFYSQFVGQPWSVPFFLPTKGPQLQKPRMRWNGRGLVWLVPFSSFKTFSYLRKIFSLSPSTRNPYISYSSVLELDSSTHTGSRGGTSVAAAIASREVSVHFNYVRIR